MNPLTIVVLTAVVLAACALALWSWHNQRKLEKLDERIKQQSELIEQLDSVLENPQLSEAEQLQKSAALLAKLQETRKP
jgi:cell division protein FtsL